MNKKELNDRLTENIIRLCVDRNERPTNACAAAGVGKSFISDMRRGQSPSIYKVFALAQYLGVTTSDLVGDARDAATVDEKETLGKEFMFFLQQLTPEQRDALAVALDNAKKESGQK